LYDDIDMLFDPVAIAVAGGEETTEVVYGITSQPPEVASPAQLLQQVQTHWQIETGLHGLNNTVLGLFLKHQ
jgi:hypothetical protein